MAEIRIVPVSLVRPLRGRVLRPQALDDVNWPGDDDADVFHLAALEDARVVGVASLYPRPYPHGPAAGDWQLRGMAVAPERQKSGLGGALLEELLTEVARRGGVRLWCNARTSALGFYLHHGLRPVGAEFVVPGVGPHYVMHRPAGPLRLTGAPDLAKFRLQVASLQTARGEDRVIIATVINEMMRQMRAPGHDEQESAAILNELDLGTLSNVHDENAVSCRAEAVETLLAMGRPHSLGVSPGDLRYAEAMRRPAAIRCPRCSWEHAGGDKWCCVGCGRTFDTFESRGLCPHCGFVSTTTECPGCEVSQPHFDFYVYAPPPPDETRRLHARCPKCQWTHNGGVHWQCKCGSLMNTFATRGLCSRCNHQWQHTKCPKCAAWSPHVEWYAYG
jgi:GNAT superfamily N-acetyltransferase